MNLRPFPCFICGSCLLIPSQRARWGHIRNPSELGSAGVLQARERTVTIPAVRHDTAVLGSSKLLFEVTNGSLQRSNQLCGFYSCPRQLPNCVNGYFGKNKERLTQKIQKGKFHCTLIFPFWKRQRSYLCPGGVALGKSDFIHIITHCIDHQYAQVIMLLLKNYANMCFSVGVTFKPHSVPYYIFVKETPV